MKIKKFLTLFAATTFLSIVTISNIDSNVLSAEGETTFDEFVGNWISKDATLSLAGGKNQVVVTQNADSVKDYNSDDNKNQWTRVTYKNPLYLADNGLDTPFVQYTIQSNDSSKYDFEALIFTLSDTADLSVAKEAVSIIVFLGNPNGYMNSNTWSYAAKGISESQTNKQRFSSYAAASNDNEGAQGIMHWNEVSDGYLTNSNNDKNPGNLATMGLYYDVNTKTVWTDDFWEAKIDTRIADGYKAKSTGSSKYDRVLIRNLSYGHDENPDTNLKKYCNYATGFGDGFNTILEKAYLSITTIRSFHSYCDPFGDTIPVAYTGTMFKGKPRDSKNGARYFIRSIDGCSTETVDGKFTKDRLQITAEKPIFDGEKVVLKQSYASGVFKVEGAHPTYVKVFDKDNNEVEVNGLDNGKFKEGCSFTPTNSGTYTVKYFENEEATNAVVEHTMAFVKVSFENGENTTNKIIEANTKVVKPENPSKEGYEFLNWFKGTEPFDFTNNITDDIVLEAKYVEKQYTIEFVVDGKVIETKYFTINDKTIDEPTIPIKEGYTGRWEDYTLAPSNETITVNAIYTANEYTLAFESDTSVDSIKVTYDGKIASLPEVPTKAGHTCVWKIDDVVITNETVWKYLENKTAKAVYTKLSYLVKFEGADVASLDVLYGEKVTKPTDPIKEGYTFAGWYYNETIWNFDTDVVKENITLTAKFTENEKPSKGCKGSVTAGVFTLITLVGLLLKKKR